jgi:hypothetical protein
MTLSRRPEGLLHPRTHHGAEAPLFHGTAHVLIVLRKVKIDVKGVGQECPTHTGNPGPREISTDLFFLMFRMTLPPDLGRLSLEMGECGRSGYGRKSRFLTGLSPGSEWQRVVVAEILHFAQDDKFVQDDRREDMVIWDECVYWGFDGCGG